MLEPKFYIALWGILEDEKDSGSISLSLSVNVPLCSGSNAQHQLRICGRFLASVMAQSHDCLISRGQA